MKIITLGTSHGDATYCRFNSSTVYRTDGGALYMVDCGAPAEALLRRKALAVRDVRAIFVTHMHEDHAGGICAMLKHTLKYPGDHMRPMQVFLPEARAVEPLRLWMDALHIDVRSPLLRFGVTQEGTVWEDENVAVRAIRTAHLTDGVGNPVSFAYVLHFKAERRTILHTGDLRADFSDFPEAARTEAFDVCLCEATHYSPASALGTLAQARIGQLIFTHISDRWHNYPQSADVWRTGEQALLDTVRGALPYPVAIAHDGDEFWLPAANC